jgi:heme/copper-type cytochrome/quinol oxidase subunit 4
MTTKKAVILTIVIILLVIIVGLGLMFMLVDITSSGAEEKVAALGKIAGFVAVIPVSAVWIMWGLQRRKQDPPKPTQGQSKR